MYTKHTAAAITSVVLIFVFLLGAYLATLSSEPKALVGSLLTFCPLVSLAAGAFVGARYGFSVWLPLGVALAFLPAMFAFYNDSALIYAPVFAVLAAIAMAVSSLLAGREKNNT